MVVGNNDKSHAKEAMVPAPIIIKLPVGTKKLTAENMKQISNLQVPAQHQQVQQHHQIPIIKLEDLETLQTLDHRDQEYDNRIAERTPIDELRAGKHILPIWADGLFDHTPPGQPRRRRKLTHLTAGEKILRRKLKNRVAAQNARDKKKTAYEDLRSDNEELRAMMEELRRTQQEQRSQITELMRENKELKLRLGDGDSAIGSSSNSMCSGSSPEVRVGAAKAGLDKVGNPIKPAAFDDPNLFYELELVSASQSPQANDEASLSDAAASPSRSSVSDNILDDILTCGSENELFGGPQFDFDSLFNCPLP